MNNWVKSAAVVLLLAFGGTAQAAPILQINGLGILTGALNVDVNGSFYDVEFVDGTCIDLFDGCEDSDFLFDVDGALAAGQALLDTVLIDTGIYLFDSSPADSVFSCASGLGFCIQLIPYSVTGDTANAVGVLNSFGAGTDFADDGSGADIDLSTAVTPQYSYAVFSESAIVDAPEPATLGLFAVGLLASATLRRRRKKS